MYSIFRSDILRVELDFEILLRLNSKLSHFLLDVLQMVAYTQRDNYSQSLVGNNKCLELTF